MKPADALQDLARRHGLLAVYLFGSRSADGAAVLAGEAVAREGSDLDIGVLMRPGAPFDPRLLATLQVELEDRFAPLRVDLVPLDRVDALFQFRAMSGLRVAAPDSTAADLKELEIMRRAADLLPFQRQIEVDMFGVATS